MKKKKLLLHVCCGPCAAHSIRALEREFAVTLFFSNSNIAPKSEYDTRLAGTRKLGRMCRMPLIEDSYEHGIWLEHVRGFENEPEGGKRCEKCFEFNLSRTALYAQVNGFDLFTTTLTISPHKNSRMIFHVGKRLGPFLAVDLKKKDGFKRSIQLSREYDLYRQIYCGCEFSYSETVEKLR